MKKRILFLLSIFVFSLLVVACTPEDVVTDIAPVISGADDKTIERGTTFVPLQGITALDDIDGDLTADITYSGNVNPNVVGVYQATYTVTDSAGNTTSITINVTVILVDTDEPLISGAADVTINLGDPAFTVMGGVTANDTVDGDLTADITHVGEVNVWVPGVYPVTYTVEDEAGNEATRTRQVTVSLGYFVFAEDNVLTNGEFDTTADDWLTSGATATVTAGVLGLDVAADATLTQSAISGGFLNTEVVDFTLAKVVISAKADTARNISISINQAVTTTEDIAITTTMTEYVQYFRMTSVFDGATLTIHLGSGGGTVDIDSVALYLGVPSDDEAPVLTVPETDVYVPISNLEALTSLVLRGVSATDNVDGNITSRVEMDLTGLDLDVPGMIVLPIVVTDNAGNETIVNRNVYLNYAFDSGVILDPTFDEALDENQWGLSGGSTLVTLYTDAGNMVVDVVSPGGWDSATSPFLRNVTTANLLSGNWYMFQFDVKAEKARQMRIRAGLELWADPWIEDFQDGAVKNLQYQVTTEWQTIYYVFYVGADTSSAGSNVVKFEIKLGTITWGSEESNNKIFLDNAQFFLLSEVDDDPVFSLVPDQPVSFAAGTAAPDLTTYVTIADKEDGAIAVTTEMIDATALNMNVAGEYDVVYTVTDNGGNTVTYTLTFTILEEADTTAPVLTVDSLLPVSFDQTGVGTVDLTAYVTALDGVDGAITVTAGMIDDDGFSLSVAGVYDVLFTVPDSSGNEATVTVQITVVDKEAPVISGAADATILFGDTFDPLDGVSATDNVDGAITLTIAHVSGHDAFLDELLVADVVGVFDVVYTVADALGNEGTTTITVTVLQIEFDETLTTDLLALQIPVQNDGGTIESVGVYNPDGSLTVTYNGVTGWYGSYSKITYSGVVLDDTRMYKLVVEAKADTAREVLVRFVGDSGTAVEAFMNRLEMPIGTEYAIYELIFSLDQAGPYNIQLQFGWEGTVDNASAANVMYFKQFALVPEKVIEYDVANPIDLLALNTAVGNDGTVESTGVYNLDGSLTVTYNGVTGWYGSYSKITYYQGLVEGVHYKLVLEGKAATARDILVRFVDASNVAIPGFENRLIVALGTELLVQEFLFVAPSTGDFNLQIQFGWESNLTNASAANVMDFAQIAIIKEVTPPEPMGLSFMIDDFEYLDQAAMDVVYTHRVPNAGANHNDAHVALVGGAGFGGSNAGQLSFGQHAVTGWDLMRTKADFDNTGLTNDYSYFAFWFKGDGVVTNVYVWLYWVGSQNSQSIDVSGVPATGGYVYVPVSAYGHTATEFTQYAIGYNLVDTVTTGVVQIDNIQFVTNTNVLINEVVPVGISFLVNDFEYIDQAAMDLGFVHRVSGTNHLDSHVSLASGEGFDGSKAGKLMFGLHGVSGHDLMRTPTNIDTTGITDDYLYFAFWYKGDSSLTNVYVWIYWTGGQDGKLIDVTGVPAEGGYVYLPLSLWSHTATQVIQYAISYNLPDTVTQGTLYVDNVQFVTNPDILE